IRDGLYKPDGVTPKSDAEVMRWVRSMPVETLGAIFDKQTTQQLTDLAPQLEAAQTATAAANAAQKAVPKASPVAVVAKAIHAGDVSSVAKLQQLVGPNDWNKILSAHAQDLLFTPTGAVKDPETLATDLGKLGRPVANAMYGPNAADQFQSIVRSLKMIK